MRSHLAVLLPAAVTLACGGPPDRAAAVHVDTLPNGALHVRSDRPQWDSGTGWRVTQDLTIGGADEGVTSLNDVRGIAADGAGRIYILDATASAVQVFDSSGAHIRTIGRRGAGPGEFTGPIGIAIDGVRLIVVDQQNVRISIFDTSGALRATHPRVFSNLGVGTWQGGVARSGVVMEQLGQWPPQGGDEVVWSLAPLDTVSFTPTDTFPLPVFTGKKLTVVNRSGGGVSRATAIPMYAPYLVWTFDPRGAIWFGVNDKFQVIQRSLAGDTIRVIERAWTPEPVSDSLRREALEMLSWFTKQGGVVSLSDIPTTRPAFGRLVLDEHGNLWTGPSTGGRARWEVFDSAGRWLGPVDFPAAVSQLSFLNGKYYATIRDSNDVVQVVRGTVRSER